MPVSDFWKAKYEVEAAKNWNLFYKRHENRFFRDRHWTTREFQVLISAVEKTATDRPVVLFEVGCGVGNFLFPLLKELPRLSAYACDVSTHAIQLFQTHPDYGESRCKAFVCDMTRDNVLDHVHEGSIDYLTLIFVLSAIHPDKMVASLRNVGRSLRPNRAGRVLFRDYAVGDHAEKRFRDCNQLDDHFYVRQDGTRAYFFTKQGFARLAQAADWDIVECDVIHRKTVNFHEGISVDRYFLQAICQTR